MQAKTPRNSLSSYYIFNSMSTIKILMVSICMYILQLIHPYQSVWNIMHEYIIPYSTSRGVLTGLYPHCCNSTTSVVSESDHWARYQQQSAVPQGNVYCPGGSFDLRHRRDTIIYIVVGVLLIHVINIGTFRSRWLSLLVMHQQVSSNIQLNIVLPRYTV